MLETLHERTASWFMEGGPECEFVVCSQGTLSRNLSDFAFPARCSDEEKRSVEDRVLAVLDGSDLLAKGQYCPLRELSARDRRFLLERNLIDEPLLRGKGPRGVYISSDQCLSVIVNGRDHIAIRAMAAGFQLQRVWELVSAIDDILTSGLDFAFDDRLGYLTAGLDAVGTGLHLNAVMHLPGLVMTNKVLAVERQLAEQGHLMSPFLKDVSDGHGDLFRIANRGTLGRSEEEFIFHLRHSVNDVLTQERRARDAVLSEGLYEVEDRVGRAVGLARGARLMSADEAVALLSSLRLGKALGLVKGIAFEMLNELLVTSQSAHLEMKVGDKSDDLALNIERANLFRSKFN